MRRLASWMAKRCSLKGRGDRGETMPDLLGRWYI
jgi:hypothetical protein